MKAFFAFLVAATLGIPTITSAAGVTIDGTLDPAYGSAIVVQHLGTSTFKNTETNIDQCGGSELDGAYGIVSNGFLYLFLAGNLNSDVAPYDKLNIFFNVDGRSGDHTLGTNYSGSVDFNHFNRLGTGGADLADGSPGLTFDANFFANYWIGATIGGAGTNPTMYVNYEVICSNCFGESIGNVVPGNIAPPRIFIDSNLTDVAYGLQATINNSNTNGVDGDSCSTNGTSGALQSVAASLVTNGIELAIPLTVLGSATGRVSVCAFIADDQYESMYNQALGPIWDGTSTYCQGSFGQADAVDFSSLPGTHHFTLLVPPCDVFMVSTNVISCTATGCVGTVTVQNYGGCPLTVTTNVSWLSVTSSSGLTSGNGSFSYKVSSNALSIATRTGQFFITDTDGSGNIITQRVVVTETGVPAPALGSITIDGTVDPAYGCPIVVQQIGTGFGDNASTNLEPAPGGSELDAAYGIVINNVLFLTLAGNIEGNGNQIMIWFMTGTNGENTVTNLNTAAIGGDAINSLARQGFTFDPGFAPNYWIGVNANSGGPVFFDYAVLWPAATSNGYYLGSTSTTNGTLLGGTNPYGIQGTINGSNTGGVDGTGCSTNHLGAAQSIAAATVGTGLEMGIPLAAIGSPTGTIYVCAFISGAGNHTYLSNQFLPPVATNNPSGGDCQGNLAQVVINLGTFPGAPHFFGVGPEMRVTSIAKSGSDVNVSWLTESNPNLAYQLQSTHALLATTVWTSVGSPTNGTGLVITQTDPLAATNKPALFYRVQQTPLCP